MSWAYDWVESAVILAHCSLGSCNQYLSRARYRPSLRQKWHPILDLRAVLGVAPAEIFTGP